MQEVSKEIIEALWSIREICREMDKIDGQCEKCPFMYKKFNQYDCIFSGVTPESYRWDAWLNKPEHVI